MAARWMKSRRGPGRAPRTMAGLLEAVQGTEVVVELKDLTAAEGILERCDAAMNIELKAAKIYLPGRYHDKKPPLHYEQFYIQAKFIRFVHFAHYFNAAKLIAKKVNVPKKEMKRRTRGDVRRRTR